MIWSDGGPLPPSLLLTLIELERRARAATGADELAFLLVNDSRLLAPCRQAALWFEGAGVRALSGVVQPESNAPYTHWLERLFRELRASDDAVAPRPRRVTPSEFAVEVAAEWDEWLPAQALWLPLPASGEHPGSVAGGLLLAGEARYSDDDLTLLGEWADAWRHAWLARLRPMPWSLPLWRQRLRAWLAAGRDNKWWRRRPVQAGAALLVALFLPVRLTVLAPGELVPANPAVIRAPLDGVIGQFHVRPNDTVKAGQALFSFDEAPLASRLEVARQALATAEAEYRQFAQIVLSDSKAKGQIAALLGKIGEKRAEAEFLATQFERSRVLAPRDGMAIFDDPAEWIGRPVQTGERVMRVALPDEMEIEAWLSISDTIPLPAAANVNLYLASSPLAAVSGRVRYASHDATLRPDGVYAFRVRAALDQAAGQRIGLKGTAKIYGEWVPFAYWMLRRPLAAIRQFVAL